MHMRYLTLKKVCHEHSVLFFSINNVILIVLSLKALRAYILAVKHLNFHKWNFHRFILLVNCRVSKILVLAFILFDYLPHLSSLNWYFQRTRTVVQVALIRVKSQEAHLADFKISLFFYGNGKLQMEL